MKNTEVIDVLIVGAGLSGIDVAYRLQTECPSKSYVIIEVRQRLGGTWDLFRYPGIRSDSDIETLGFPFRGWVYQYARRCPEKNQEGHQVFLPSLGVEMIEAESLINLSSNYIKRSEKFLPKQGSKTPWKLYQNYFLDWLTLKLSAVDDGYMKFS